MRCEQDAPAWDDASKTRRLQRRPTRRTLSGAVDPLADGGPLIGVAVFGEHRISEEFERDGAGELIQILVPLPSQQPLSRRCRWRLGTSVVVSYIIGSFTLRFPGQLTLMVIGPELGRGRLRHRQAGTLNVVDKVSRNGPASSRTSPALRRPGLRNKPGA
jgi:hypothetical protein